MFFNEDMNRFLITYRASGTFIITDATILLPVYYAYGIITNSKNGTGIKKRPVSDKIF